MKQYCIKFYSPPECDLVSIDNDDGLLCASGEISGNGNSQSNEDDQVYTKRSQIFISDDDNIDEDKSNW